MGFVRPNVGGVSPGQATTVNAWTSAITGQAPPYPLYGGNGLPYGSAGTLGGGAPSAATGPAGPTSQSAQTGAAAGPLTMALNPATETNVGQKQLLGQ